MSAEKIKPYEHLSDQELWQLSGEAALLRLQIASTDAREVVAEMIACGCPRKDAAAMMRDPHLKQGAYRFYFDRIDAELGNREAKERAEFVAEAWAKMRRGQALVEGG